MTNILNQRSVLLWLAGAPRPAAIPLQIAAGIRHLDAKAERCGREHVYYRTDEGDEISAVEVWMRLATGE